MFYVLKTKTISFISYVAKIADHQFWGLRQLLYFVSWITLMKTDPVSPCSPKTHLTWIFIKLFSLLFFLFRSNQLKWEDIKDQIWIKLGADKGGGSVKVYYQIMNVDNPNSPQNTTVFCAFEADESSPNLHIALDSFIPEINDLIGSQTQWRYILCFANL